MKWLCAEGRWKEGLGNALQLQNLILVLILMMTPVLILTQSSSWCS